MFLRSQGEAQAPPPPPPVGAPLHSRTYVLTDVSLSVSNGHWATRACAAECQPSPANTSPVARLCAEDAAKSSSRVVALHGGQSYSSIHQTRVAVGPVLLTTVGRLNGKRRQYEFAFCVFLL